MAVSASLRLPRHELRVRSGCAHTFDINAYPLRNSMLPGQIEVLVALFGYAVPPNYEHSLQEFGYYSLPDF